MTARRLCSLEVDVINPEESAQTAAGRMHARKVGTLVVVDDERIPIGILTDRDIAVRLVAEAKDAVSTPVNEIMTRCPETVREETPLEDALRIIRAGAFRRLPVVDRDERVVGLLSLDDVIRELAHELSQIERLVEQEAPDSLLEL